MQTHSEVFNVVLEELPVRRLPFVIFKQQHHLPAVEIGVLKLKTGAERKARTPIVFLEPLDVDRSYRPQGAVQQHPWTSKFHARVDGPGIQIGRILVKDVASAGISPEARRQMI